jgi:hypothetical protein
LLARVADMVFMADSLISVPDYTDIPDERKR